MKFEKKQFITDLQKGMNVNDIFVVKSKSEVIKYSSGFRFELLLGDKTGDIYLKYWGTNELEKVKEIWQKININDVIYVEARVNIWNNVLELSANNQSNIRILNSDEYFKKDFIEVSESIDKDLEELKTVINNIDHDLLKQLLLLVFSNSSILTEFKRAPASYLKHYYFAGGLLKHTLNVTKLCTYVSKIHENIDKNLLLTGALLHDLGRIKQFKIDTVIKPSKYYYLESHENLSIQLLLPFYEQLNISQDLQLRLNHLIISHHSNPSTPEAHMLKLCNELDSKIEYISELKRLKKDVVMLENHEMVYFN